nr:hypothetical protein HK105_006391 [Polyrhizophydium stewartii]
MAFVARSLAPECKQQLGLHDAYTVFDVFVLNVINCLALHEIDRLSTGPAHATGEDGSTESFLFHLVRINDCSDATALARTVARLEEADVIDARVLLDVGLRMLYVLVVHGQCAGATTRGAAVQPLPPDRILDAVSRTLTIAAAIPGDAPLKATTSTLHHALYLLSVLSVQDANSMMRPFTVSCLFEWLEQHWLAIVPRAGTVSAGSLMAMSFLAVDRSHDAAILAWLWSDLVGQFEKRAIVLAVPSLVGIMAVATRSIQTGATALDDALVQAAWSACMEHLGEPQDMRESWQAALLCTVVSLVNAAQDALERGEKVFSRTRAIAGMTLMQRIQAFFMIATGSCKQENAAVRDKTLAQSSADLNSRLNHAILSILVDSAAGEPWNRKYVKQDVRLAARS